MQYVSVRLVAEMFDNFPEDMTPAERLVLLALAEAAQDEDRTDRGRRIPARTCFPGIDTLSRRAGLSPAGLSKVFQRLSARGLDPRISVGIDKVGRPIYAAKGHATEYRVPSLKGWTGVRPLQDKGHRSVQPIALRGWTGGAQRVDESPAEGGREYGPNQKEPEVTLPPTPQSARPGATRQGEEDLAIQELQAQGIDLREARAVVERASSDPTTKTSWRGRLRQPGYLATCREAVRLSRQVAFAAGEKCEDHDTEIAANCRACAADYKVGQRDKRFIGRHQPNCSGCFDPLLGYDDGVTRCRNCSVQAVAS